jgi:hypothetical protein
MASCVSKSKTIIISDTSYDTIDANDTLIDLPPPLTLHFSQRFSLNECFSRICKKETPRLTDKNYICSIYETENHFVMFFIDAATYKKGSEEWQTKKGSDLKDKYYPILDSEFDDKNWIKVIKKVQISFAKFSLTDEFKNSPLGKVKPLTIRFDDANYMTLNQN